MMNFILFTHKDAYEKGVILKKAVDSIFKQADFQTLQTFSGLKARLKNVSDFNGKEMFILLAENRSRLNELTALIDLLEERQTILILPDESKTTLSKASQFSPRFFTTVSDTYTDLCEVLKRMISKKN